MRRPTQVAIYIFRQRHNQREYLLLRRIPEAGGFWQGVTGGVEDDETVLETAARELFEETGFSGLCITQLDYCRSFPVPESMKHHFDSDVTRLTEFAFHAKVEPGINPTLDPQEHTEFMWVTYEQALSMLHHQANIDALKLCEQMLS